MNDDFPKSGDNFELVGQIPKPTDVPARILALLIHEERGLSTATLSEVLQISKADVDRSARTLEGMGVVGFLPICGVDGWILGAALADARAGLILNARGVQIGPREYADD